MLLEILDAMLPSNSSYIAYYYVFENDDESPTVLTYNIIKYSYLFIYSTHNKVSSSDSNHMT